MLPAAKLSLTLQVWNNTSESRLVLIADCWHPALSETQKDQVRR